MEELIEKGKDIPRNGCSIEKEVELRDYLSRLPKEIINIGLKRMNGYALTPTERKKLERFRKLYQNNESENII